mmetsp:Transcript_33817/g.104716  ORF Transcript_33817/g.104716 Transcript_33817/m.104716 type:complete len:241 (-) Transcript_33817:378-1100(-)
MEGIRQLVRLDADQARLDAVDRAVEVLRRRVACVREELVEQRRRVVPEVARLQHHPLPEERLRLVRAHRERSGHGQAVALLVRRAALLVERVPDLVHRPGEALEPVAVRIPRCDPSVRRARAAREGMSRHVETAFREVEPQVARDAFRELGLFFSGARPAGMVERQCRVERVDGRLFALLLEHSRQQRSQPRPRLAEDFVEAHGRHAALELVERAVVRLAPFADLRPRRLCDLALEREDL